MSGEEKRTRSKRCLSRNKRSKVEKATVDDPSSNEATGEVFTVLKSKRSQCLNLIGTTDNLENEFAVFTEETSEAKILTGKSRNDQKDVFEFLDEESDDTSEQPATAPLGNNKRKRIASEELEVSCFSSTVSKFKRARNAITCLKQPLIQLEKCTDNAGSEVEPTDKSCAGNRAADCTEVLFHNLDTGGSALQEVGGTTLRDESICGDNVGQVETDDLRVIQDPKCQESREDCHRKHDCPVCGLTFPPTENMDVFNRHINSCLDSGSDYRTTENDSSAPGTEKMEEEMFFCQLCQKDLSRMNSQRRQQHINRCCDEASKVKDTVQLNRVQGQTSIQLSCPICGKGFKSLKSRQAHLKKCAQEYNVGTNQLLEIMRHEKHQEDSNSVAAVATELHVATNKNPVRVKRKRRAVVPKSDLDEETQIALALSASMAPPLPPDEGEGKTGKRKGKKNKGGNELPPLLLRDDETAQKAVAIRAAQVLCTQEDNNDEDDEISCTPALAPSRLAQHVSSRVPPVSTDATGCNSDDATSATSVCKEEVNKPMDVDSENDIEQHEETKMLTFPVDPALSKSFLNFLYDVEDEERESAEVQAPRPSPLWSLSALKESCETFYVQGLLPPASPPRSKNFIKRVAVSDGGTVPTVINKPAIDTVETVGNNGLGGTKARPRSVTEMQASPTKDTVECPEITPSQAVNVEMLLELAEEDDISNISVDSQQMTGASGFCVDEQDQKNQESEPVHSGVPKLLQDLSSMINNPRLSDVVICLQDGQEIAAHSFILSLRSDVLKQLLSEGTASSKWQDKVYLKFDDVCRSVFEVALRHIYTGDVTIPVQSDVDDVENLAARLELPCLAKACKVMRQQMNQVSESQEDDDKNNDLVTDLEKLEENLWRNGDDDGQLSGGQKERDDKDDFLNDDDIEEIVFFQTQALKMKGSVGGESLEEKDEKFLTEQTENEDTSAAGEVSTVVNNNTRDEESRCDSLEKKRQRSETCGDMNKGSLSHSVADEGNLSRYNVVTVNLLHDSGKINGSSCKSVGNRETAPPLDVTEKKDEYEMFISCEGDEEKMIEDKRSPSPKEHLAKNEVKPLTSSKTVHELTEISKTVSCEDRNSTRDICISTCELGPVSEQPQNHVEGRHDKTKLDVREHNEVVKELSDNEELPSDYGDCVMEFELEYNEHSPGMSKESFSDKYEKNVDDFKDVSDLDAIHETLSDFQPHRNEDLDVPYESAHKRADCLSPPSGEGLWDIDETLQGSTREVTVLDDDEVDGKVADESITLLSDNDEEDLDDSPAKADVTVVPETPRVARNTHHFSSSSSLSTLSASEEDDVRVTSFSPSKTRKQLSEEANDFLSKLKQRVDRDKDKRRGKGKRKKKVGMKDSAGERSVTHGTPRNRSPRSRQDDCIDTSPLACDVRVSVRSRQRRSASPVEEIPRGSRQEDCTDTSPLACDVRASVRSHQHPTASPAGDIPRDLESCSNFPLQEFPRDVEPRRVSPERISPGYSKQSRASPTLLHEDCVSDCVVLDNSPPLSPDLFQQQRESPQNSAYKEKGETMSAELLKCHSPGGKNISFENLDDVDIVESCANQTAVNVSRPLEVMSPPVPSPEYSFLEPIASPGSPKPRASPLQDQIVCSPDSVSPGLPVGWKSTQSESGLGTCAESNSPVSPSVCSFSSQIADSRRKSRKQETASRKLDLEKEKEKESTEPGPSTDVIEIDLNLPLMERIRAARNGGKKIYKVKDVIEDGSDEDCMEDKLVPNMKKPPEASSQKDSELISTVEMKEVQNISVDADLDFHDDGGYNFDVEELQSLERLKNDNQVDFNEQEECHPEKGKSSRQEKVSKPGGNKRKIPPSQQQRKKDDDEGENKPQKTQKKRGKKAESETSKAAAQSVSGRTTPMPNYNDMATPVLKIELQKFGVRPLPKKKMVKKLKEIYDYTHQVETLPQQGEKEQAVSDSQPASSNVVSTDVVDGVEGSGTASSDNSDEEDTEFGDCTVMIEDEVITASQQANGGNLKEKLLSYVTSNKELYKKLLKFQPQELVSLHQQIKSGGINCSLGKLVDFLDEQCLTFTTAGSRTRAPRKGGRKKKINNKS